MSDLRRITTINIETNTFYGNTNIVNVDCNYTPWQNNSMHSAFMGCHNLKSVNNINNNVNNMTYTFYHCHNLTNVSSIPNSVQNMIATFYTCTNLINAPVISDSVISMNDTFYNCYNLTNVPSIPNSVQDMIGTFRNCTSLVNAPIIPNSVIYMAFTFDRCTNLTNVPSIPNSVQNMAGTFEGCTNLINTPVIPDSVKDVMYLFNGCTNLINGTSILNNNITSLGNTFRNCINLTGDIYIYSEKISDLTLAFAGTSKIKNVYIPFNNAGINTITYNTFISAGYTSTGTKEGVYLKDLNESPVPPTPSDEIDVTDYTYTQDENGVVTLSNAPIDENGEVIFPNI